MDLTSQLPPELAQFEMNPALAEWVKSLLQSNKDLTEGNRGLVSKSNTDAIKIQALTLELAYYKRIRFANKSEQFSAEQRELFEESWNTDTSAITAEVAQVPLCQTSCRL